MTTLRQSVAQIQWLSQEEGGRLTVPDGPVYSTVARFETQREDWLNEAWSLVLEFLEEPDLELSHRARIRLLAKNGPNHFLEPGNRFELLEGAKVVAKGVVLAT